MNKKTYDRVRKKMADQARANSLEAERQNGMRKSRSSGNLQDQEDEAGHGKRMLLGQSLKKAIRATRDNILGAVSHPEEPQQQQGVSGGAAHGEVSSNHSSPVRNTHASVSSSAQSGHTTNQSSSAAGSSSRRDTGCIPS